MKGEVKKSQSGLHFILHPLSFILLLVGLAAGVDLNPPEIRPRLDDAIGHSYRQEYQAARDELDQIIADYPDNPAGYFFEGALWQLYMFDMGSDSMQTEFDDCMARAQQRAEAVLATGEDARAHLYLGAVYTYRAMYAGWKQRHWDSYKWGMKAPAEMGRALELDSSLADANLALGVNEYFRYAAGRYLTGLKLFGSYGHALELIDRAGRADGYFSLIARYVRAYIMRGEKRYDEATGILDGLLAEYPGNRLFRKLLRDTYLDGKLYDSALAVGEGLAQEYDLLLPDNAQARAENYYALARCYHEQGDAQTSRACCDSIIAYEPRQDAVIGLPAFVKAAKALKKRT
jgi:hypothetical protein